MNDQLDGLTNDDMGRLRMLLFVLGVARAAGLLLFVVGFVLMSRSRPTARVIGGDRKSVV